MREKQKNPNHSETDNQMNEYINLGYAVCKKQKDETWTYALSRMNERRNNFRTEYRERFLKENKKNYSVMPLTEEEVNKIQESIGGKLPEDYRQWLLDIGYYYKLRDIAYDGENPAWISRPFHFISRYEETWNEDEDQRRLQTAVAPCFQDRIRNLPRSLEYGCFDGLLKLNGDEPFHNLVVNSGDPLQTGRIWASYDYNVFITEPIEECEEFVKEYGYKGGPMDFIDYARLVLYTYFN